MKELEQLVSEMRQQLGVLQQEIENIKEYCEITRESVNMILEWADDASIQNVPLLNRKSKQ